MAYQAGAYPSFCSMKRLGIFPPPPLDGMLVHRRVTPSIKFAGTHLYAWVERGTVRVKCLAQEHNTMSPTRARTRAGTRSAHSGVERTNHEATAPSLLVINGYKCLQWSKTLNHFSLSRCCAHLNKVKRRRKEILAEVVALQYCKKPAEETIQGLSRGFPASRLEFLFQPHFQGHSSTPGSCCCI